MILLRQCGVRSAQVGQDLVDDGALSDGSDDAGAAAAALTVQNVDRERTLE